MRISNSTTLAASFVLITLGMVSGAEFSGETFPSNFKNLLESQWKVRSVVFTIRGEEFERNGKPDNEPHLFWGTTRSSEFALAESTLGAGAIKKGVWTGWSAVVPVWLFDKASGKTLDGSRWIVLNDRKPPLLEISDGTPVVGRGVSASVGAAVNSERRLAILATYGLPNVIKSSVNWVSDDSFEAMLYSTEPSTNLVGSNRTNVFSILQWDPSGKWPVKIRIKRKGFEESPTDSATEWRAESGGLHNFNKFYPSRIAMGVVSGNEFVTVNETVILSIELSNSETNELPPIKAADFLAKDRTLKTTDVFINSDGKKSWLRKGVASIIDKKINERRVGSWGLYILAALIFLASYAGLYVYRKRGGDKR